MKKLLLLISLLMFCVSVSAARMYQWIDPDTKTTQLSGKPPHWYRTGEAGPRVVVFDNGKVIDDTGIELSVAENDRIRQQALIIVEQDRLAAMQKLAEAQRQKAVFDTDQVEEDLVVQPSELIQQLPPDDEEDAAADDAAQVAEQMRQLLEEYETLKTQNARDVVESQTP